MRAGLSGTHVRYLAAIHRLSRGGKAVSSAEVARELQVSRPSVTRMLEVLNEKGVTEKARYGKIGLTAEGRRIAECIQQHTDRIAQLLAGNMGLTPAEAVTAAEAVAAALPERVLPENLS